MLKSPLSPNKNRDFFDKLKAPDDSLIVRGLSRAVYSLTASVFVPCSFFCSQSLPSTNRETMKLTT